MNDDERRQAIDDLAAELKNAKLLTVEYSADKLGLHLDWGDSLYGGITVRTKRIKYGDDWETWYVEPPGHKIAETRHVKDAARLVRELSGEERPR